MVPTLEHLFQKIEAGKTAVSIKAACSRVGVHTSVYAHARDKYKRGLKITDLTTSEQDVLVEILRQIHRREKELFEELSTLIG